MIRVSRIIFEDIVSQHNLTPRQMYNAEEIALYGTSLPKKTCIGLHEMSDEGLYVNKDRPTILS